MKRDLNKEIFDIIDKIIANENLCKLIKYTDSNPLSQPKVMNPYDLVWTYITPIPKVPKVDDVAGVYINVFYDRFRKPNGEYLKNELVVQIIIHESLIKIKRGIRFLSIFQELNNVFDVKSGFGVDKMEMTNTRYMNINNGQYMGFEVIYKMIDVNGK